MRLLHCAGAGLCLWSLGSLGTEATGLCLCLWWAVSRVWCKLKAQTHVDFWSQQAMDRYVVPTGPTSKQNSKKYTSKVSVRKRYANFVHDWKCNNINWISLSRHFHHYDTLLVYLLLIIMLIDYFCTVHASTSRKAGSEAIAAALRGIIGHAARFSLTHQLMQWFTGKQSIF